MFKSLYTTLLVDVGGVFLTNGWDRHMREKAAQTFQLDDAEMNSRHSLAFDTYEIGKMTLDKYLERVIFYIPRSFSKEEFKEFMFAQSQSYPEMIQLIREVKERYSLRTVVISNEGRELMIERMNRFLLREFIDVFVCSSFVGLRKPDEDIYHMTLDMIQVPPEQIIYIDDRPMLVEIGRKLGLQSFQHINFEQTEKYLKDLFINAS